MFGERVEGWYLGLFVSGEGVGGGGGGVCPSIWVAYVMSFIYLARPGDCLAILCLKIF